MAHFSLIFTIGIVLFLLAIARAIVSIANVPIDVMVITATFITPISLDCIHITMCYCSSGGHYCQNQAL